MNLKTTTPPLKPSSGTRSNQLPCVPAPEFAAASAAQSSLTTAAISERCISLGLPTWQATANGESIVANTGEPAEIYTLLSGEGLATLLRDTITSWSGGVGVRVAQIWPDCWLIGVPDVAAGRLISWTLALAASPIALVSPTFEKLCRASDVDELECRRLLLHRANHDRRTVRMLAASMGWMTQDLARVAEDHATIKTFAHQVTDGLDALDVLQGAGRGMRVQLCPRDFVQRTCDRLHSHGGFPHILVWFASARGHASAFHSPAGEPVLRLSASDMLPGEIVSAGELYLNGDQIDEIIARLCMSVRPDDGPLVTPSMLNPRAGGATVVLPISRGDRLLGLMLAHRSSAEEALRGQNLLTIDNAVQSIAAILENAELYSNQQRLLLGTLGALTATIDAKDRYTCGHSERVAHLARQLALAAGLSAATAERLHICGLVHDIGKIGIPEEILRKPGKLTSDEYEIVKTHSDTGYTILRQMPMLSDVLPGIRHHHERWDGKGYPLGLAGDDIPLFGRIIAVADTFDAMSSDRSYRSSRSRSEVLAELQRVCGSQLDTTLVTAMLAINFAEYDELMRQHKAGVPPVRLAA